MRLLLDTHAFLWGVGGHNLSTNARLAFLDPSNDLYLSSVSYWEICIKATIGKLNLTANWQQDFDEEIMINKIKWLPVEKIHCQKIINLPMLHNDPFDRLIIAQALCEDLTLMTADANIRRYTVPTLW